MYWLLVLLTVFGPMAIAGVVIIGGAVHGWARIAWLVGWGYAFVPACYLGLQSLCGDMSGTCGTAAQLDAAQESRVALAALLIALVVLAVARLVRPVPAKVAAGLGFIVLVAFAEVWMFLRLHDAGLGFPAIVCLVLLAWGIGSELTALRRAYREAHAAGGHDHAGHDHGGGHDQGGPEFPRL